MTVGFVCLRNGGIIVIDLDQCVSENLQLSSKAKKIIKQFSPKTYIEYSPSRTGVHIIIKGSIDHGNITTPFEIYCGNHFIALTGQQIDSSRGVISNKDLDVVNKLVSESKKNSKASKKKVESSNLPIKYEKQDKYDKKFDEFCIVADKKNS